MALYYVNWQLLNTKTHSVVCSGTITAGWTITTNDDIVEFTNAIISDVWGIVEESAPRHNNRNEYHVTVYPCKM